MNELYDLLSAAVKLIIIYKKYINFKTNQVLIKREIWN